MQARKVIPEVEVVVEEGVQGKVEEELKGVEMQEEVDVGEKVA